MPACSTFCCGCSLNSAIAVVACAIHHNAVQNEDAVLQNVGGGPGMASFAEVH